MFYQGFVNVQFAGELFAHLVQSSRGPVAKPIQNTSWKQWKTHKLMVPIKYFKVVQFDYF